MSYEEEKEIGRIYREMIKDELKDPEVQQEKRRFIKAHFEEKPVFFLRPALAYPALSFCLLLVFFLVFRSHEAKVPQVAKVGTEMVRQEIRTALDKMVPDTNLVLAETSPVLVKRLVSQTGPTMIYRSAGLEVPILIVWVFPNQ